MTRIRNETEPALIWERLDRAVTAGVVTALWFWQAAYHTPHSLRTMLVFWRDKLNTMLEEMQ